MCLCPLSKSIYLFIYIYIYIYYCLVPSPIVYRQATVHCIWLAYCPLLIGKLLPSVYCLLPIGRPLPIWYSLLAIAILA